MKRILCPKCENYVVFDETKQEPGKPIVLVCNQCAKQLTIRLRNKSSEKTTVPSSGEEVNIRPEDEGYGHIVVIENGFGYKQKLPLTLGDNIVGRQSAGLTIQVPIITGDPSVGRNHCVINVKQNNQGELIYTLRDFPSLTGTFLMNRCLGKKEQIRLENGDVVTIGATTFIVYKAGGEEA